ncbi:MAG: prepilin peptidase [Colwellia sp.]|uniref:A24 family peptidase n=1 Tax=Colwellia sp. TaxID=56799 RepID=UPI001D55490A|nr:prepilin peptidase [Colwellia sp.]NQY48377.1 prepilin peptidase [Colwellia sp.]
MNILTVTLLLLLSALYFDLRYQRIPNKLCLAGLLIALALQGYNSQWHGLGQALFGGGAALALLLPAFYFRCLGAGDVKLMVAVGALSGPNLLWWSIVYGIIFGTFTSFMLAFYQLGWSGIKKMASQSFIKNKRKTQPRLFVPYAPALTLGWLLACYLSPEIGAEIATALSTGINSEILTLFVVK